MKVVILCGGRGERLKEETEFRPKPMITVGGKPILWHVMKIYSQFGFTDFVLALGYKGDMIRRYFLEYTLMNNPITINTRDRDSVKVHGTDCEDWCITMVDTGENSLKGSRLKQLEPYLKDETFMMTYGDGVSDVNLDELLKFHRAHGKIATVTGVRTTSKFGSLKTKGEDVKSFVEKPVDDEFSNGGFFVFNRGIFNYLSEVETCDLETGALEILARSGQLKVYKHPGEWYCMDTPREMEHLNYLWENGEAFWRVWL